MSKFIKVLEEPTYGEVSYIVNGPNLVISESERSEALTRLETYLTETNDQNMSEPVEVTVKLIKQRKPEHIDIDFVVPKVIL